MVKYLQMDGVDDFIKLPSITFNKVVLDVKVRRRTDVTRVISDFRTGIGFSYLQQTTGGLDAWGTGTVKVDGVTKSNNTVAIPNNTRCIIEHSFSSVGTDDGNIFTNNGNTINTAISGDIYNVKLYNGTTLVAHYDMTTGTVQDQSGNGKHATLNGGTFLDDGTGGGDAGTEVSTSYSTKNVIYRTASNNYDSKQHLYQSLISAVITKQSINKTSSNSNDTLIDIYNTSVTKIDNFSLKVQIYKQESNDYSLIQRLFKEVTEVKASVHNHIFVEGISTVDTKQIVMKLNSVHHTLKQTFYKSNQTDYDTLQQLLSDWNEYRQVVEFILSITTKKNESIEITQRKNFNLNI
jgi:hypothetical protein